ncbi:MAG: nitric-oxide reductase large subunit [Armatimonadota bacterium]
MAQRPGYEPRQRDMARPISGLLKLGFVAAFVIPMLVMLIGSKPNAQRVPPYPERVVSEGRTLTDKATIMRGQHVWQEYGLMDQGSVWGHGSLRGMDFSALTLHMVGQDIRDHIHQQRFGKPYSQGNVESKAIVDALTLLQVKTNTYNKTTRELTLSPEMASSFGHIQGYWDNFFLKGNQLHGFLPNTIPTIQERRDLASFFFWTGWAAGTKRPGSNLTYTNNWPADKSVGNTAPDEAIIWSFGGILSLFVVLGIVVYITHRYRFFITEQSLVHLSDRMAHAPITPSQRKVGKYLGVVVTLFLAQILVGGLLAHYTVHPASFFLQVVAKSIPFSLAKSWHLQLGIFWIATAWVASALYIAPLVGGREPEKQGLLVDLLFGAVVLVVFGSLAGEALSIKGLLSDKTWFWIGHQGWEYLELGRLWQTLLFIGLIGWILITLRAVKNRLREEPDRAGLLHFYLLSAVLVVLFFGFGLLYNPNTHLSVADYWRWFVVHIWVEGIFEFFAVASAALLFVMLGLVTKESALRAAYLTAILAFSAGIIGMSHHYFWFGQSTVWLALGSVFSSLEPIPLIMLASRGWMEYKSIAAAGVAFPYRWPLLFLVASAFWNFLGGGVFGFAINLPIINYYEHGTYLTSNHGHTALFGTYGMLSVALALFVWRGLVRPEYWREGLLKTSFWGLNIGLFLMFITTLLPIGIMQFVMTYREGTWLSKSATFFNQPAVQFLGNMRAIPDLVLILFGAVPLAIFTAIAFFHMKECSEGVCETVFGEEQR